MADQMTWMIVEDDHAIRDVVKTMCELWDVNVIAFKDGFEAMAYLENDAPAEPHPQVALIDIRMPGPWGHEISAKLREHPALKNIGIVLMTAYALPGKDEETYLQTSGADRLIYKPLPPMDELRTLVNEIIESRSEDDKSDDQEHAEEEAEPAKAEKPADSNPAEPVTSKADEAAPKAAADKPADEKDGSPAKPDGAKPEVSASSTDAKTNGDSVTKPVSEKVNRDSSDKAANGKKDQT